MKAASPERAPARRLGVAYRYLFAACFACGLIAVGCGSGGAGSAATTDATTSDDVPSASDHAPASNDQAPGSKDQPPPSSDQAPAASATSKPSGSGVGAEAACRAFCDQFGGDDCAGANGANGNNGLVGAICEGNCKLDPEDVPCEAEAVAILDCLSRLPDLCTTDGSDLATSDCPDEIRAASACQDAHRPPEMPTDNCTMDNGCDCGQDMCKSCRCVLGENSTTCDAICM
jgi:hypothetical protein